MFPCTAISGEDPQFFLYSQGYTSITTHSIKELASKCKKIEKGFSEVESYVSHPYMFYIPTRSACPDLLPEGTFTNLSAT